jgi:uncharacterized protein (DUF433 family)
MLYALARDCDVIQSPTPAGDIALLGFSDLASGNGGSSRDMKATGHRYIVTDERILSGKPIILDTRTPVRAIVELWRQGIAPEAIPTHLPHLTLAQVFDALSYFSDHQDEIQRHIERNRVPEELIDPLVRQP